MIQEEQPTQSTKGSILIVDDEPLIAVLVEDAFREAGYKTILASTGTQALEVLEAEASHIQGLITDIQLPDHIDGWAVARRAREISPGLPVLYFTGDGVPERVIDVVAGSRILYKPLPLGDLLSAMAENLGSEQAGPDDGPIKE